MTAFGRAFSFSFLRVGLGALTLALALAALAWTASMARVALAFGRLPEVPEAGIPNADARDAYVAILTRLATQDPANVDVRKRLAVLLAQQRRHDLAKQEMERAMATCPTPDGLYFLASVDDKLGLIDEASELTRQAIVLDPANRDYRDFGLRLLSDRFARQVVAPVQGGESAMAKDRELLAERRGELGVAALDWAIRAPGDKNAFFFLANFQVGPPLDSLLAYRCFLAGLSLNLGKDAAAPLMMQPRAIIDGTVRQIIENNLAKPYPGIDLAAAAVERSQ